MHTFTTTQATTAPLVKGKDKEEYLRGTGSPLPMCMCPASPASARAEVLRLGDTQIGVYLKGLEEAGGGRSVTRDEAEGGIGKGLSWVGPEKVQEGSLRHLPLTVHLQWPLPPYSDIPSITRGCPCCVLRHTHTAVHGQT